VSFDTKDQYKNL